MTARLLPREDWHRLEGTLLEAAWPHLPPDTRIVVVERDGAIVACSALFQAWHQEGTWKAEHCRGDVAVGRELLRAMRAELADVGAREVFMMATTPETSALCQKFGHATKLDADHFAVQVRD